MPDKNKNQPNRVENDNPDNEKNKPVKTPGEAGTGKEEDDSTDLSSGGLANSRTGQGRTSLSNTKTFITGTDGDGQNI